MRVLSDVPVLRNWYKTVSNLYKKTIYTRFYIKIVETDHIQQMHNQSEKDDIPEEPKKHRFALILMLI